MFTNGFWSKKKIALLHKIFSISLAMSISFQEPNLVAVTLYSMMNLLMQKC